MRADFTRDVTIRQALMNTRPIKLRGHLHTAATMTGIAITAPSTLAGGVSGGECECGRAARDYLLAEDEVAAAFGQDYASGGGFDLTNGNCNRYGGKHHFQPGKMIQP